MTPSEVDLRQLELWWKACLAQGGGLPPGVEPVQTRLLRSVGRGELPDSGPVFLKVMGFPRAKDRLRYLFRALPAVHEARMLERLRTAGVATPLVIAARGTRFLGLPRLSLLVTAALPPPGPTPGFAALARAAAAVAAAGVFHPDLNSGNFHALPDGRVAVLDLQSARARPVGEEAKLAMAAKLWIEHGAQPERLADLEAAGLVASHRIEELRRVGGRMRTHYLVSRIRRCRKTSTGFALRRRWNGVVFSRRSPWPRGRWIAGGPELVRCWIGDRALEVLDGCAPRIHALFRKSWWFPGQHSVYIASADTDEAVFQAWLPGLLEGCERYGRLRRGETDVNTTSP